MLSALFIGDIMGRLGRSALGGTFSGLIEGHLNHVCISKAENVAGGFGLTPQVTDYLFGPGFHTLHRAHFG